MEFPRDCAARYVPERPLGEGGFGVVWRARDTTLGRPVAIKLLRPEELRTEVGRQRFEQEARITAKLVHPAIVALLDFGCADAVPWIAYELLEGHTLRTALLDGPLAVADALLAARAVAAALTLAHRAGVVHRDVKPENIFRTQDGALRLMDFGIAKVADQTGYRTQTGVIVATPAYVAPELINGAAASPASDVYALGCTLFELVTARPPFDGTIPEVLKGHLETPPPRVTALASKVPRPLERVIARCLAKRPADRFASAAELALTLDELGSPSACAGRTAAVTPARPPGVVPTLVAALPRARRWPALAAIALTAGALATVAAYRRAEPPTPPAATASLAAPASPARPATFIGVNDLLVLPTERDVMVDFFVPGMHDLRVRVRDDSGQFEREVSRPAASGFHERLELRRRAAHRLDIWIDGTHAVRSFAFSARDPQIAETQRRAIALADPTGQRNDVIGADVLICGQSEPDETYARFLCAFLQSPQVVKHTSITCAVRLACRVRSPDVGAAVTALLGSITAARDLDETLSVAVLAVAQCRAPDAARTVAGLVGRVVPADRKDQWLRYLSEAVFLAAPAGAVDLLAHIVDERTALRNGYLPEWMISLDRARARAHFERWLDAPDNRVRWAAISGLTHLGDDDAVDRLAGWLASPRVPPLVDVEAALEGLAAVNSPAARERLAAFLAQDRWPASTPTLLWSAARQRLPGTAERLAHVLDDATQPTPRRLQAACALGYLGGDAGRPALERALALTGERDAPLRRAAVWALLDQRGPRAVALGQELLARESLEDQALAAFVLAESGHTPSREAIGQALTRAIPNTAAAAEPWLAVLAFAYARLAGARPARALAEKGTVDVRRRLRPMLDWLEQDPAIPACLILPRGQFQKTGVRLRPGDAVQFMALGGVTVPGRGFVRPFDDAELLQVELRVRFEARIGPQTILMEENAAPAVVWADGPLAFSPFGHGYESEGYALVRAGRDVAPPIDGAALVLVRQPRGAD